MRRPEEYVWSFSIGGAFGLAALVALIGCGPKAWMVADILADKVRCAIAHQNLPNEQIVRECAVQPEDIPRVLELVGTAREQAAIQALQAEVRQAEKDQRAGVCR